MAALGLRKITPHEKLIDKKALRKEFAEKKALKKKLTRENVLKLEQEERAKQVECADSAYNWLRKLDAFSDSRPLAIGIRKELYKIAPLEEFSKKHLRAALRRYVNRSVYQILLCDGGDRFDLDGNIFGEVTPAQQATAWGIIKKKFDLS